jgi:hypothetical protein
MIQTVPADFQMVPGMKSPIFFHHGLDKFVGVKRLGEAILDRDGGGVQVDPDRTLINLDDVDGRKTYERAERGELGWSSGTAAHLVKRTRMATKSGFAHHIDYWPLGLDASLTPNPAEKRNVAVAIKSMIESGAADELGDEEFAAHVQELKCQLLRLELDDLTAFLDGGRKTIYSFPSDERVPDTYTVPNTFTEPVEVVEVDPAQPGGDFTVGVDVADLDGAKAANRPAHGWETQPRDELGKWTEGSGRLSVEHVERVMRHEGIDKAHHLARVRQDIAAGKLKTRKDVLAHIDAIHDNHHHTRKERAAWVGRYVDGAPAKALREALTKRIQESNSAAVRAHRAFGQSGRRAPGASPHRTGRSRTTRARAQ